MPVNYTNTSVDVLASSFQVLEELGSGSFGVVYKAIEKESGTIVAIKHIDLESSEDDIQEIQQEISVLSSCASPFVTQYYGSFVRGFKLWIIMEYLAGGSCLDLLKPGPFSETHIAIVMRELLLGLEYLHREGKIHRDIKAANILLSGTGQVKLADFGVATQLNNIKSQRNTFVGTPFWMAPEVISQVNPYSFKADIWSLGITAIELGQGEPPHATIHPMKVLFLIPKEPAPRLVGNRWSRDFKDFIEKCLVKNPNQRSSAKELLSHRFIKNAGRIEKLQELIERRQNWQASKGVRKSHPRLYEETMNTLDTSPEESWDFDTIRTNPHPGTLHINHKNTIRNGISTSERSISSALQGLNINAAPQCGVTEIQGRKVSNTAIRINNLKRSSSASKKSAEKLILEQLGQQTTQKTTKQENPLAPEIDYGKASSTVRQFKRVPHISPRASLYESLQGQNSNTENEDKPSMCTPTTENGFLGRHLFSDIVQNTLSEMEGRATQSGSQSKLNATSRLTEAWNQLDAIDPESSYELLRTLMDRLQQHPQLHSIVPPKPIPKASGPAPNISTPKPSLSGTTFLNSSPLPKAITRAKRANSSSANKKKKRSSRQSGEFSMDDVNDEPQKSTPADNQLADVLYGRWLEGLRGRWGAVAK